MEFRLLGPVEVYARGGLVPCGPPRQRTVLAALAVDVGRPVLLNTLIDRVWGEAPPERARHTLYVYIARLRGILDEVGVGEPTRARLLRRAGGYLLDVDPMAVDAFRFRRLLDEAGDQGCDEDKRAALLREALHLWQGIPLADISGDWAERVREGWHRQRVEAALTWASCELRLGRGTGAIVALTDLVTEYPLVEPLTATLMRVLHDAGRTADALDRFAAIRRQLAEQLGVTPGPQLRQVHREVLHGPTRDATPAVVGPPTRVPRQLPLDVADFTGRGAELDELDRLLDNAAQPAAAVAAISGTAGVGKTALAVRWAHRAADRFPEGQLYVNLRGYDPERPMTAAEALARLLAALGLTGAEIPPGLDERAARFRTETAGRRMLIVLDNAASAEQVRPLLPGSPTCAVLVTSRDGLAGLVARDGARRLDLDVLPTADARALLRRLAGARVDAEPDAAAALAERCGRLPLALRVAAELAASRPAEPFADLLGELSDLQTVLHRLDAGGDSRSAVATVFSWSVRHLSPDTALAFRMLGLHPGPDLDVYAAAALTGTDAEPAREALRRLARAHLVHPVGGARYAMHDLLRAYAAELTATVDTEAVRREAVDRLVEHYLATTAAAMDRLYPAEAHLRPRVPAAATPTPALADPSAALAWLDAERPILTAVTERAAAGERPASAVRLAMLLHRYLDGGHFADALAVHGHARAAARRTGDLSGEAHAWLSLGIAHHRLGRYAEATEHLRQALAVFRQTDDPLSQARALSSLGTVAQRLGRYDVATEQHEQALALFRRLDDQPGEARALNNLGLVARRAGRFEPAVAHHRQALALFRRTGHCAGEAIALNGLGNAELQLGRYGPAGAHLCRALAMFGELGRQSGAANALESLGNLHVRLGRHDAAAESFAQALRIFREIGERDGQAAALNGLGTAAAGAGRHTEAIEHYAAGLAIAEQTGARDQQARAHAGLAAAYRATGDAGGASSHQQRCDEW